MGIGKNRVANNSQMQEEALRINRVACRSEKKVGNKKRNGVVKYIEKKRDKKCKWQYV